MLSMAASGIGGDVSIGALAMAIGGMGWGRGAGRGLRFGVVRGFGGATTGSGGACAVCNWVMITASCRSCIDGMPMLPLAQSSSAMCSSSEAAIKTIQRRSILGYAVCWDANEESVGMA